MALKDKPHKPWVKFVNMKYKLHFGQVEQTFIYSKA